VPVFYVFGRQISILDSQNRKENERKEVFSILGLETFQVTLYVSEHPTSWGVRTPSFFSSVLMYTKVILCILDSFFIGFKRFKRIDFKKERAAVLGVYVFAVTPSQQMAR
jgi:hypothetical protein